MADEVKDAPVTGGEGLKLGERAKTFFDGLFKKPAEIAESLAKGAAAAGGAGAGKIEAARRLVDNVQQNGVTGGLIKSSTNGPGGALNDVLRAVGRATDAASSAVSGMTDDAQRAAEKVKIGAHLGEVGKQDPSKVPVVTINPNDPKYQVKPQVSEGPVDTHHFGPAPAAAATATPVSSGEANLFTRALGAVASALTPTASAPLVTPAPLNQIPNVIAGAGSLNTNGLVEARGLARGLDGNVYIGNPPATVTPVAAAPTVAPAAATPQGTVQQVRAMDVHAPYAQTSVAAASGATPAGTLTPRFSQQVYAAAAKNGYDVADLASRVKSEREGYKPVLAEDLNKPQVAAAPTPPTM